MKTNIRLRLILKRKLLALISLAGIALAFQNCAPMAPTQGTSDAAGTQKGTGLPLTPPLAISKVDYGAIVEMQNGAPALLDGPSVQLDLAAETMTHIDGEIKSSCSLPLARLEALKALLANAKVCATVSEPKEIHCMLFVPFDIRLGGDSEDQLLKPVTCAGDGRFLCDKAADAQLRTQLRELAAEGCK